MNNNILVASGSSEIFVYNYEGRAPTTNIGRVFVEDPDDWDLPDKMFRFKVNNSGMASRRILGLDSDSWELLRIFSNI